MSSDNLPSDEEDLSWLPKIEEVPFDWSTAQRDITLGIHMTTHQQESDPLEVRTLYYIDVKKFFKWKKMSVYEIVRYELL
jgi:hypothetical protein